MLATGYSRNKSGAFGRPLARAAMFAVAIVLLHCPCVYSQTNVTEAAARHAQDVYESARRLADKEPTNLVAALELARAAFDWAEFATSDNSRAALGQEGIAASQKVLQSNPNSAGAHYYLGMNLGQVARTKRWSALKLVDQMETEFERARQLDEHYSHAGPDRNLGLLYLEAPGWPLSIGNRGKARKHLERAVELAPDYPENQLNLLEAFLKWGDRNGAKRQLESLEKLWPQAKKNFTGEEWAASWVDWESRLKAAREKLEELLKPAESPRSRN